MNIIYQSITMEYLFDNNRKKIIYFDELISSNKCLKMEYTYDGIHFNNKGIEKLKSMLIKEIRNE